MPTITRDELIFALSNLTADDRAQLFPIAATVAEGHTPKVGDDLRKWAKTAQKTAETVEKTLAAVERAGDEIKHAAVHKVAPVIAAKLLANASYRGKGVKYVIGQLLHFLRLG